MSPAQAAAVGALPWIQRVAELIRQGDTDGAGELLRAQDLEPLPVPALHEVAELAEAAGCLELALGALNLLAHQRPEDPQPYHALARLRLDQGETERAARLYRRLLELNPDDAEAALALGQILEAAGQLAEATDLYLAAASGADDQRLEQAARAVRLQATEPVAEPAEPVVAEPPPTLMAPADAHAVALAELFAGREGVHARQWHSNAGRTGYTPVHEPLTPAVARQHLLGTYTVGTYTVRLDNSTGFLCLDLDLSKPTLEQALSSVTSMRAALGRVQQAAVELSDRLAALELPTLLEDSGKKGRHLWLFFRDPLPARLVRQLAQALLERVQLPHGVQVEVFPRQSRVPRHALGNLVKVPLGVHLGSGRRALFVDASGQPLPDQLNVLLTAPRVTAEGVQRAIAALGTHGPPPGTASEPPDAGEPTSAPAAPQPPGQQSRSSQALSVGSTSAQAPAAHYELQHDLEAQRLLAGCGVLAAIVRRARETHRLDCAERVVLTHSLGCLENGAHAVNAVLDGLAQPESPQRLKRPLRGHPISCARVRKRLPELCEGHCGRCALPELPGSYPSPVLHARSGTRADNTELARLELDQMVLDYFRLQGELSRLQRSRDELEHRMRQLLQRQQDGALHTSWGVLRAGNGQALVLEGGPARESAA